MAEPSVAPERPQPSRGWVIVMGVTIVSWALTIAYGYIWPHFRPACPDGWTLWDLDNPLRRLVGGVGVVIAIVVSIWAWRRPTSRAARIVLVVVLVFGVLVALSDVYDTVYTIQHPESGCLTF